MRRLSATVLILLFAALVLLGSCENSRLWSPRDNRVDPGASNYQGYTTVTRSADIAPIAPANGGILSGAEITIDAVAGATAYEIRLAPSAEALDSAPTFDTSANATNVIDIASASMTASKIYYWKARGKIAGEWDRAWSPSFCFRTSVTWPWIGRSSAGSRDWVSIGSSADGTHLASVMDFRDIWTSTNAGTTWTDQKATDNRYWYSIASSADGTHLAAVAEVGVYWSGDIWTGVLVPN